MHAPFHRYRRLPLRAKLAIWATLGAFGLVVTFTTVSLWLLRENLAQSAMEAEATVVDTVARDLGEKIAFRLQALELQSAALGHRVPLTRGGVIRSEALDDFFYTRPVVETLFNDLLVIDLQGRVIHTSPYISGGVGSEVNNPDDFRRVVHDGRPVVSEPMPSRTGGLPVVDLSVPLRDDKGEVIGVLVGQLFLDRGNILSDVGRQRMGRSGHVALVGRDGVVIAHPDAGRLMKPMSAPDAAIVAEARAAEGTTAFAARNGMLYGAVTLDGVPWVVQATYPASEAYAVLERRERLVLAFGTAAAMFAGVLAWSLTGGLLRPLDTLRRAMGSDGGADGLVDAIHVDSADLAALLAAYKALVRRRQHAESALALSERRMAQIADNLPALVAYVDKDQCYRYTNATYREVLGRGDPLGQAMCDVLGATVHASILAQILAALRGQRQRFEHSHPTATGEGHLLVDYVPAIGADGTVDGFYAMMVDISARKAAETSLARSERRLLSITDNLPANIGYIDHEQRYRFLNAEYRHVMGADPAVLIGKTMREVLGDAGYVAVQPRAEAALRGERQHFERFDPKGGKHLLVDYVPDLAQDGSADGFYVMVLDITLRKQAELALAESERRVRAIADSMPALIIHYDRDERITFANARVGELYDRAPQSIVGTTLRELRGEEVYARVQAHVASVLAGVGVDFEIDEARRGELRHYASTYMPDHGPDGTVRGFYVLTTDITDRKRLELSLSRSAQQVRTITDNLPALISRFDRDSRYTFANRMVVEQFGVPLTDILGRTVSDIRDPDVAERAEHYIALALAGETTSLESSLPLADRTGWRHYAATFIPEIDADGVVQGAYALAFDITERKQAELASVASERRLQQLLDTIPATVGYFDMDEVCRYANATAVRTLGIGDGSVPGISMRAVLGDTVWSQHAPYVEDVLTGGRARFDGKVPFPGREAHYQAHLIPDRDASGTQRGYHLMTFDVTALKEAQQRQARVEAQLRSVTDNLPVLISYLDRDGRLGFLNETFRTWFGTEPAGALGRPVRDVIGEAMYADRAPYLQRVFSGERVEFEVVSTTLTVERHLHTVYVPDVAPDGTVSGAFCMSSDVTARKRAEKQLELLVRSDVLTGLANRYGFNEALPLALARSRRSGMAIALMFLDIDHFKQINDRLGHNVGDEALKTFAGRLQQAVRITDTVARLAGDEFVIILEGLHNDQEPQAIARKILAAINRPFDVTTGPLAVTTSLGIAYHPSGQDVSTDDLLARADKALYEAKAAGRNTFRLAQGH